MFFRKKVLHKNQNGINIVMYQIGTGKERGKCKLNYITYEKTKNI
jgi:hypothetical protein